ncbi:hypothetical protein SAY87_023854 [Trapa incisa]|uniref:Uncharacterized protein n=1 Tax=Trapa incisa TaxID=236973 RepID=A0AAN7QUN9_9MYRT|nr:hypothetical protein SAY87_023854 [Trapa incisa]
MRHREKGFALTLFTSRWHEDFHSWNLLPQRSFHTKNVSHENDKSVLMIPDMFPSDGYHNKPSTSRSLSTKATHSLPVTPTAISGLQTAHERTREVLLGPVSPVLYLTPASFICRFADVSDLGPRALAISLPHACVLDLLSPLISSTMVSRSYIWAYASFQYAIVIFFAHIFYTMLNVNAVLSVLLSCFTGFGIAISNSLLVECLRWRASRQQQTQPYEDRAPQEQQHKVQLQSADTTYSLLSCCSCRHCHVKSLPVNSRFKVVKFSNTIALQKPSYLNGNFC